MNGPSSSTSSAGSERSGSMTQAEYRPEGAVGLPDWNRCWAGVGNLVCEKFGKPEQLGMCDDHFEELRG